MDRHAAIRRRLGWVVVSLATLSAASAARGEPRVATPAEVEALIERLPVIAAPRAGQAPFIARGSMPTDDDGYDYEVVWTGRDYRAALLDPDDGTPLLITDENTMYACDVIGGTPWIVVGGRFAVAIAAAEEGAGLRTNKLWFSGNQPLLAPTRIDIREAVRRAAGRSTTEWLGDGSTRLTQAIDDDRVRVIVFEPGPSRNVSFAQLSRRSGRYTSFHSVRFDGIDADAPALAMPPLVEVMRALGARPNSPDLWTTGRFQIAGHLGRYRRAIRGNAGLRGEFDPPGGWEAAAERDAEVTRRWAELLKPFHVAFLPPEKPWVTTTQPTRRP